MARQKRKTDYSDMNIEIKKKKKTKKKKSQLAGFLQTFCVSFVVFAVVCTSVFYAVDAISDTKVLGGEDIEDLEETVEVPQPIVDKNSPFFEAFQDSKRINIILMGNAENLTDTIMLASLDLDSNDLDIISIPRDTYYERPGYNGAAERKINAAYRGNALNTAYAVSDVLNGMPIHYYVVVDYEGVENIVNSMSGVPMNIETNMKYYDPYNKPSPLRIDIPAGQQVLDGEHAVQFLRFRGYTEGDIGRVKAQQEFVKSAIKQCLSFNLPKIATTVYNNVDSNITLGVVTKLAKSAVDMTSENVTTHMLPHTLQGESPWYVYPTESEIEDLLSDIYSIKEDKATDSGISSDDNDSD